MTADDRDAAGTDEPEAAADDAPPSVIVRYNPRVQAIRTLAILGIAALCTLIPAAAQNATPEQAWKFAGALIAGALIWAVTAALRIRDRTPQVVIERDGIFVRRWSVGLVPWENIDYIGHSSSIRRGLVASITRNRRKPYLLFRMVETPRAQPTLPPPFGWWQFVRAEFAMQEPVIEQYGLDVPVNDMLAAMQEHIEAWRSRQPEDKTAP
jgi:hypothetical protein